MKKIIAIFVAVVCATPSVLYGAVNVKSTAVKKAAPVATKQTDKLESATSLLPTVISLVANAKDLSAKQQQLSADCAPSSTEIEAVNDLVKEWAKTGTVTASSAASGLGVKCGSGGYKWQMAYGDDNEDCYDVFDSKDDAKAVWYNFPKVSSASRCDPDGNNKNCKTISNIYDIFSKIPFDVDEDYTNGEVKKLTKLKEKMERCSDGRLKAAKTELYGNFVTQALGSVGQTTGAAGTASVMEAVTSLGGSGNIQSMLPSLGQMATKIIDK